MINDFEQQQNMNTLGVIKHIIFSSSALCRKMQIPKKQSLAVF